MLPELIECSTGCEEISNLLGALPIQPAVELLDDLSHLLGDLLLAHRFLAAEGIPRLYGDEIRSASSHRSVGRLVTWLRGAFDRDRLCQDLRFVL